MNTLAGSLAAVVAVLLCIANVVSGADSIYSKCADKSAVCFGFPENCVSSANCKFLFRSQYNAQTGFQQDLNALSIAADRWIAVGFTNQTVSCMLSTISRLSCNHVSFKSAQF